MTPELWQRLKPLYNAALDLPREAQSALIEDLCADDQDLARELRALLTASDSAWQTFDAPLQHISRLLSPQPKAFEPGAVLGGRFRIVRHLGSGGMGDVYEALDEQMEQGRIALKTIRPDIAENAAALARFKDEVRLARRVSGPNVCRIHELYLLGPDHTTSCSAFLTMELLEGVTLQERIAQSSPLPMDQIRQITAQLCTALCCIHEAGIIHQDLKPRNVMLLPQGDGERVVVMDFGLARAVAPLHTENGSNLSGHGLVAGTPSYMAPEQFEGREVGPPTDIYALGLILYEMATGVQPFAAHTPLAAAIRRGKAPLHASSVRTDLPPIWDEVIERCLCYEPDARFVSAGDLNAALTHPGKVVLRLGPEIRVGIPNPALFVVAGLILCVLCAGLWFTLWRIPHRELAPDTAHWYTLGMTALREGSYLKATRLLGMVAQRDPTYALAHAALADAWTELDFTEAAQHEMLLASAPNEQRGLSTMERQYIDAVRSTLVRDYSAAAQDYEAILKQLPADSKAQGYVDLGRIYEKAGKVHETVASYEKAATLNPDDPAPFLHLGILKSRLRDPQGAAIDFNRAEALYTAESDQEGLAEIAYQRGYAANGGGNYGQAEQYLNNSLTIARQIPNVQMEVRSLSQLSSVEDNNNHEDQALALANQAVQIASAAGLEYWVTDGLIRVGNALMGKEAFREAQPRLQEALQRAEQNGHPRLEAFAKLNLASLCDQQGRSDAQITFAKGALKYYRDYGFLNSADQALTLIARGERDQANYAAALQVSSELIRNATQTHQLQFIAMGHELIGDVLFLTEQFPGSLDHYQQALKSLQALGQSPVYEQIHCAEVLWHLGRANEANSVLSQIGQEAYSRADLGSSLLMLQATEQQSLGHESEVLALVDRTSQRYPAFDISGSYPQRLQIMAYIGLARNEDARRTLAQYTSAAIARNSVREIANAKLLQANLAFHCRDYLAAREAAEMAQKLFQTKGLSESQAFSLLLEARAASATGDMSTAAALSQKSLDIFRQLQQSWGDPVFQIYRTRPDVKEALHDLQTQRGLTGAS